MYRIFTTSYKVGDVIWQEIGPWSRHVLVTKRAANIKNGRPGFDGLLCDSHGNVCGDRFGPGVWGYDYEVAKVVKRT